MSKREAVKLKRAKIDDFFSDDEITAIRKVVKDPRDQLLILIGIEFGLRASEICQIEWSNFNGDNRTIRIKNESTGVHSYFKLSSSRWKPIWKLMVELTAKHRGGSLRIFQFSYKTVNRRIQAYAKAAGIERPVNWHMLRRSHIIRARTSGESWERISERTGILPVTLIQKYAPLLDGGDG